jgi:phospholipase/carboxylesterase
MAENSVSLVHVIRRPTSKTPGKPPLLILLHGVGSNENDLMGLAPYLDGRFLIVSLRAPLTLQRGSYGWYHIEWTANGIEHDEQEVIVAQATIERVINELTVAYDVDPKQVYLMGFSQGAIMSLRIALAHPENIAGAVIMSGRMLPDTSSITANSEQLKGLPMLVVHGTQDNVLPISSGRQIDEFLKHTPVALTYKEYNMAHTVSQESLSDIAKWLTARLDSKN